MMDHRTVMGFSRDRKLRARDIDREVAKRALRYVRPYRRELIGFLIAVVGGALTVAVPALLLKVMLATAIPHRDRGLVVWIALGAIGLALANAVLSLLQRWYSAKIGEGLIYDLRVELFDHVQRMPIAFFTRTQLGSLQSRMNNDVIGAQQAVTSTLGTVVSNIISVGVTLIIMASLSWQITLLTLLALPAFIYPARRLGPRLQGITREGMQQNAEMNNLTVERFNVAGALVAKLFGRPDDDTHEFSSRAARVRDIGVRSAMLSRVLFVVLGLVAAAGTATVYWLGGMHAVTSKNTTDAAATLATLVLLVGQVYQPLAQLTNARVDVLTTLVSFERVFEVLDFPAAIVDRPGAQPIGSVEGAVEFDHVWFRHPDPATVTLPSLEGAAATAGLVPHDSDRWTLRDISFTVQPGETIALVGPSGAGKTTIAMLVPRINDVVQGSVTVDGHDVRDVTLDSLHGVVGLVPQDPHLFHDTIRMNMRYAKPDATDHEIEEALRGAQISDLVASLPDGLDTVVGERGYRMSGGEKQRLAIARLLLKNPAIVILDEATSHLDSESESHVQRALVAALTNRTAIVIAHRLSTIVSADRILVVEDGRVVEEGTHQRLLARNGVYADLYRTQYRTEPVGPDGPVEESA
jgi:ATP-binding cassette subfamily B protein